MTTSPLEIVLDSLSRIAADAVQDTYSVPDMWHKGTPGSSEVNPAEYYRRIISGILERHPAGPDEAVETAAEWTNNAVIYNLFVRLSSAFDHNGDGTIGIEPLAGGFRETGTLLKAIAMLPYIQRMGANTIYLLPLTTIGEQNRKGRLGSPYAVKNPYELDPMLGEPALELPMETQLRAFVEAAHRMQMRVVFEFVFRIASIDSDWVASHPDWFYWIRTEGAEDSGTIPFGQPWFDPDTLRVIHEKVEKHDLLELPAPDEAYRAQFVPPPESVRLVEGGYEGIGSDGTHSVVASAFSDWPPDDRQPPWTDVAYLKMHRHSKFNYIAYNTIRMYDRELEENGEENDALWEEISGIIPWYQKIYDIDGAMIDMGHALPARLKASIVARARDHRQDFAFWDENFDPSPAMKNEGFNAVFGSLPFVIQDVQYIKGLLNFLNKTGTALPFFATGENHNTPRVCHHFPGQEAGRNYSIFLFTLGALLPALPFLHSGMEICEWHPVNLGLNFTDDDRNRFPQDQLPLFSPFSYDWKSCNNTLPLNDYIAHIIGIRRHYLDLILSGDKGTMTQPYISDPALLALMRKNGKKTLIFAGNSNMHNNVSGFMEFGASEMTLLDLISQRPLHVHDHRLHFDFSPGQCCIFELPCESTLTPVS